MNVFKLWFEIYLSLKNAQSHRSSSHHQYSSKNQLLKIIATNIAQPQPLCHTSAGTKSESCPQITTSNNWKFVWLLRKFSFVHLEGPKSTSIAHLIFGSIRATKIGYNWILQGFMYTIYLWKYQLGVLSESSCFYWDFLGHTRSAEKKGIGCVFHIFLGPSKVPK